jgi:hypothetical protein
LLDANSPEPTLRQAIDANGGLVSAAAVGRLLGLVLCQGPDGLSNDDLEFAAYFGLRAVDGIWRYAEGK